MSMYLRFSCANATKFFTSLASLTSHVVPCRVKNWMSWKGKCCNTRRVGHTRSYRQEKFFIIPIEIYIQSLFYSFSRKTVGFSIQCQENKEERRIMQCHFLGYESKYPRKTNEPSTCKNWPRWEGGTHTCCFPDSNFKLSRADSTRSTAIEFFSKVW